MKICIRCSTEKVIEDFYNGNVCRACRKSQVNTWRRANKDRVNKVKREYRRKVGSGDLLTRYGITRDQYQSMLSEQNSRCLVCLRESERVLQVDHDHKNGKVRGLLCWKCNTFLGLLNDDIPSLQRAIDHIKKYK